MATYTKIRATAISASMPADTEGPAAAGTIVISDLSGTLAHMASAIKRIHGNTTWTDGAVGTFYQDLVVGGATPKLTIGDAGAEDTMLVFDGNAQDYRIGLDDGTDKLELGVGSAHGTTTAMTVDASQQVVVVTSTEATTATDGALAVTGGVSVAKSAVIGDDLDLLSDGAIMNIGSTSKFTLTAVDANNAVMASANHRLAFGNAGEYIAGDGTDLSIVSSGLVSVTGDTNIVGTLAADTSLTLDTTTITTAEIAVLDSVTAGTAAASKALVLDASSDIAGSLRNVTMTGDMTAGTITMTGFVVDADGDTNLKALRVDDNSYIGSDSVVDLIQLQSDGDIIIKDGAYDFDIAAHDGTNGLLLGGVTVTSSAAELNYVDVTPGTATASKAVVLDGSKNIATIGTVGCGAITSTGTSTLASLVVTGDLTVEGTQTAINSTQVNVEDKQMRLGIPGGMTIRWRCNVCINK